MSKFQDLYKLASLDLQDVAQVFAKIPELKLAIIVHNGDCIGICRNEIINLDRKMNKTDKLFLELRFRSDEPMAIDFLLLSLAMHVFFNGELFTFSTGREIREMPVCAPVHARVSWYPAAPVAKPVYSFREFIPSSPQRAEPEPETEPEVPRSPPKRTYADVVRC